MVRYGYVINLDRCTGCQACVIACKVENSTSEGIFWMHVFRYEEGEYPHARFVFYPRPCMHCEKPPCVKVCPVGARYRRDDSGGQVLTDFERCIGCRYCEVSCPYGVNFFNWKNPKDTYYYDWESTPQELGTGQVYDHSGGEVPPYKNPELDVYHGAEKRLTAGGGHFKGTMEKCTFCVHRVDRGVDPACVANCPMKALTFGDLDDPDSDISKLLQDNRSFKLLEELGTSPRVFYIGGAPIAHGSEGDH